MIWKLDSIPEVESAQAGLIRALWVSLFCLTLSFRCWLSFLCELLWGTPNGWSSFRDHIGMLYYPGQRSSYLNHHKEVLYNHSWDWSLWPGGPDYAHVLWPISGTAAWTSHTKLQCCTSGKKSEEKRQRSSDPPGSPRSPPREKQSSAAIYLDSMAIWYCLTSFGFWTSHNWENHYWQGLDPAYLCSQMSGRVQ